jgi:signal transduction histidine kinase
MLVTIALFAAIAVAFVGAVILWSNPARLVNRAVFTCSLHIALWLTLLHIAVLSKEGLPWVRMACAVGAWVPLHFWAVKESIAGGLDGARTDCLRRAWVWVAVSVLLSAICFTEFFIPSHSTAAKRIYGQGYYCYIAGDWLLYVLLFIDTFRGLKDLKGARRLELQVWLGGGTTIASTVLALMAASALTHSPTYIRLQPLFVILFYAATGFAITMHRIFDARQIFLVGAQKCILVIAVTAAAFGTDFALKGLLPEPFAFCFTTAIALWFAAWLNGRLDRVFHFYPEATAARQAAFAVTRREMRIEGLEKAFLDLLKGWGQTEHTLILTGAKGSLRGGGIELAEDCTIAKSLRQLRWATPERLARERSTPEREALAGFLAKQGLGVLVIGEGPTLTVLIGVGIPASRRPFTYPQVTQLLELASIIESALERAHFSVKAQHAEQLATVGLLGASLAHEIRNPLVTIKTFVQLLPKHHQDPAFREKFFHLIGDEVTRIDRLTEQLLDLAAPRTYTAQMTDLHPVLSASIELVAAKAADKRIRVVSDLQAQPDRVFTDATAAKQVLLNLCFNAIQAVERREGERWVRVATRNVVAGLEMSVEDSGPGIAPEIRPRLFQPFQSTKSTGFGLGLAICSDILAGLNASITVDPPAAGRGATFRVTFPCQPFSS